MARRFYEEIHFKMNDLMLYYNFPVVSEEIKSIKKCHHIEKLRCSKAASLTAEECITIQKCELHFNSDKLFYSPGIDVMALQELDQQLRER